MERQSNVQASILIPLYNAEKYIEKTLESVLSQTYQNFEVIIVDDGSTDRSLEKVQRYQDERIKIICNAANKGIADTRNTGLAHCSGKYVALLDDDDIAIDTRLEKQIAFLEEHNDIDAVGGNAQWIDEDDNIVRDTIEVITDPSRIRMFLLFRNIFNNSEMTFRRAVAEEHRLAYSDHCFGMEDYLFWIQFSKVGKIGNIPELVLKKRVSNENETAYMRNHRKEERRKKYVELQKYSLVLDGFKVKETDEHALMKFFAEEPYYCRNVGELQCLSGFLQGILKQAGDLRRDYDQMLARWFEDLLSWNLENMKLDYLEEWKKSVKITDRVTKSDSWFTEDLFELISVNRQFSEKEQYLKELRKANEWLEQHSREQEQHIGELLEAKEWLGQHSEEQEQYIAELLEAKEWLEKHSEEQEQYIAELLEAKEWLWQHSEEQEQYIAKLLEAKKLLEKHGGNHKQHRHRTQYPVQFFNENRK